MSPVRLLLLFPVRTKLFQRGVNPIRAEFLTVFHPLDYAKSHCFLVPPDRRRHRRSRDFIMSATGVILMYEHQMVEYAERDVREVVPPGAKRAAPELG